MGSFMGGGGGGGSAPPVPETPAPYSVNEDDARKQAQLARDLARRRKARASLVIDPTVGGTVAGTGIGGTTP